MTFDEDKKNNFAMLSYVLYEICKYKTLTDDRENRLDEGTEHIVLSVLGLFNRHSAKA